MDVGCVKIRGLYEQMEILDLNITVGKNKHAEAFVKGIISDEEWEKHTMRDETDEKLIIVNCAEAEEVIYAGLIKTINIRMERDHCIVCIHGVSASVRLDRIRKSRSFQDISYTVQDIIREVIQDTPEAGVIFNMPDKAIGVPLIQYEETDWEFIMRICSLCQVSVFADIYSGKARIYCGIPKRGSGRKIDVLEEAWEFDPAYYSFVRESGGTDGISKWDFLFVKVCSYEICRIGEEVIGYGNRVIERQECRLKGGIVEYIYDIAPLIHTTSSPSCHENIRGVAILGTILDVRGEDVKLWLEIDERQEISAAYWYPWKPESGNAFYCMPEIGAQVYLYIGGKDERGAIAIGCKHESVKGRQDRTNPSQRSLKLDSRKGIHMFPEMLEVSNDRTEGNNIMMDDRDGMSLESNQEISICAGNTLRLAGKRINFQASEEILMVRKDIVQPTVINMSHQFDAIGRYMDVNANGNLTMIPGIESEKPQTYSLKGAEEDIIASTPYNMSGQAMQIETVAAASRVNMLEGSL